MDSVREAVRGIPTQLSIPILRTVLKAPAPLARVVMNELTEPLNRHLPYIRKVYNGSWVSIAYFLTHHNFSLTVSLEWSLDWRRNERP